LHLRDGEKQKFARRNGGTNKLTKRTLTADQVIGEIINGNNAFIPIPVGLHGEFGSIFRRFLNGSNPLPLPNFRADRPNALCAAEIATTNRTPYDILGKADKAWKAEHPDKLFGGTYLAPLPSVWANQRLGLACQSNLSNHINALLSKIKYRKRGSSGEDVTPNFYPTADDDCIDDGDGWKFYDGPLHGEDLPDDERDGLDTAVVEDVDGLLMPPASSLPRGVT
jgi:hypothetical protein